jgi:hypothetical protein
MLRYKLEENKSTLTSLSFCCEVCGTKPAAKNEPTTIKEFHKDGTTKIHYTCSNHIVDLYNRIIKEIENK